MRSLSDGGKFTADELCERELLPKQFSYKILKKLQKANLVEILRGAEGGFRLAIDLKSVTLYDFFRVMEANRLVGSCMEPNFECEWRKKQGNCRVHNHLHKIQSEWDAKLAQISLHQLIFENP